MKVRDVTLRCADTAEIAVFSRYDYEIGEGDTDYEISIMDSYCGGDFNGILGRFKRAWRAFWAKPVSYTGVYIEDTERMKKFLTECLELTND